MSKHNKNRDNNIRNTSIGDSTFPIIPFLHMTYAHISSSGGAIHMDIGYENGKKRKVSIY